MRCSKCGFPLSPNRAQCPRCGQAVNKSGAEQAQAPVQSGWRAQTPTPQVTYAPPEQQYSPQPTPSFPQNSGWGTPPSQQQQQQANWQMSPQLVQRQVPPSQYPGPQSQTPRPRGPIRPGIIIAGVCLILSGLLLLVVFMIWNGQKSANPNVANTNNTPQSQVTTQQTPNTQETPTTKATETPTATATPAGEFPGKAIIDGAQVAHNVDAQRHPVNVNSEFHVGSDIYVTFNVHNSSVGAGNVCLNLYINNAKVNKYNFEAKVYASKSVASYAQFAASAAGEGYVEIAWATKPDCSDQLLAQKVTLTITR